VRKVTVHIDDHLWKFSLSKISISTKRGGVFISPIFPKIFWKYYNKGWLIASGARFRLTKGNLVMFFIVFKKDDPKPYEPKGFIQLISVRILSPYLSTINPYRLKLTRRKLLWAMGIGGSR